MRELVQGSEIAGYRIDGVAGRGGMGVVYRATQLALDRTVALKVIAPDLADDASFRERFKRESKTAASIRHPNVISIYDARGEDGLLFISMDFIEGTDLRAILSREGPLEPRRAVRIVAQVADALDAAHRRGLVHRDVKPANVLVASENGGEHVYLTDFGLTKDAASESGMTKTGMFVGTLDYIAPEQLQGGPLDARADVYALGCVLYETVSGQVPYPDRPTMAKMWAHANEPAPRIERAGAPEQLQAVVERAMAKDPNERYLSAGDLAQAAIAAIEGQEVTRAETSVASGAAAPAQATAVGATRIEPPAAAATVIDPPAAQAAPPTTAAAPAPPPARRRPIVPILAAVAGVVVIAVVAIVLASSGGGKSSNPTTAKNGASRDSACAVSGGVLGSVTVVPGQRIGVVRLGEPRSEVNTDMGACRGASNFLYYAVGTNTMEIDFDGAGNVERVIAFPAPNFLYKNVSGQTTLTAAKRQLHGWSPTSDGLVSPDHKTVFVPYDNGANSNSGGASPGGFKISAKADY